MTESISYVGLFISLLLPWLTGCIWVRWILRNSEQWNWFIVLGQGYLIGVLAVTALMVALDKAGVPLSFWTIAAILSLLCIFGIMLLNIGHPKASRSLQTQPAESFWSKALILLLIALIATRYLTLLQEILLRPLYPWDAWMNWAPKAIVWFEYRELIPFVSKSDWLRQGADVNAYSLGASKAWMYPPAIPLIQLWGALGLGAVDHHYILLPWVLAPVALGLALFGHLRLAGIPTVGATLACYMLLNMPYFNVQTALAGYADIWLAVFFGCASFALFQWYESRYPGYAVCATLLALMCTQLKIPGLILGGIIVGILILTVITPTRRAVLVLFVCAGLLILGAVFFNFEAIIPGVGKVAISATGITLPYIGVYHFEYHPVTEALFTTTFMMLNWNLHWYLLLLIIISGVIKRRGLAIPSLPLSVGLVTLSFVCFVYYFTNRYIYALDYTQINRALIYVVPTLIFYIAVCSYKMLGAASLKDRSQ